MDEIAQQLHQARRLQQSGNYKEAESCYVRCLVADSSNVDALFGFGLLLIQLKRYSEAIEKLKIAIALQPDQIRFWDGYADAYEKQGKPDEAIAVYQLALQKAVDGVEVLLSLAPLLHRQNRLVEAEKAYRNLTALKPDSAPLLNNYGLVLHALGKHHEAIQLYESAVNCDPNRSIALINLANVFLDLNDYHKAKLTFEKLMAIAEKNNDAKLLVDTRYRLARLYHRSGDTLNAELEYQNILQTQPHHVDASCGMGALLLELGRVGESEACLTSAVELSPKSAEVLCNLGNVRLRQGRNEEAELLYRDALAVNTNFAPALFNIGLLSYKTGRLREALESFKKAVKSDSCFIDAWLNLGITHSSFNQRKEAVHCFNKVLALRPNHAIAMSGLLPELLQDCDWRKSEILAEKIRRLVIDEHVAISPFYFLTVSEKPEDQFHCARAWAKQQFGEIFQTNLPKKIVDRRKLRIGYLSADFHNHATTQLLVQVLEMHDANEFETIAFSYGPNDQSAMRKRVEQAFHQFFDVQAWSSEKVVELITQSNIDILVDLKGYTRFARTDILARRPAAIQVNYLGYPGTMGAPFIDYIIADHFVIPADEVHYYSEAIAYLPNCYQPNDRTRQIAQIPTRAECGLPENTVVLCAFHQPYKITPEIFDVWMRILRDIPNSALWLLRDSEDQVENLRREACQRQVDSNRLIFAPFLPLAEHLARFSLADIFLDTYPINAHTTASEAIWVGVPTVTYSGDSFASRVAGSILRAAGLPDCVTQSLNAYYELAVSLAQSVDQRESLRQRILHAKTNASLFDSAAYTRDLENLYREMWQRYRSGLSPLTIDG